MGSHAISIPRKGGQQLHGLPLSLPIPPLAFPKVENTKGFVCLFVCLLVCLFACLFVCLFLSFFLSFYLSFLLSFLLFFLFFLP